MLQTMIVGSLPRPTWLAQPGQIYAQWRLEGDSLSEGQDDAVQLAIDDQHDAGVTILTDGEQRRRHYIWGFCEGLEGIDYSRLVKIQTRGGRYGVMVDAARVVGPTSSRPPDHGKCAAVPAPPYNHPVKVTLPGPMTTADTLADEHYGSRRALAMDLARLPQRRSLPTCGERL